MRAKIAVLLLAVTISAPAAMPGDPGDDIETQRKRETIQRTPPSTPEKSAPKQPSANRWSVDAKTGCRVWDASQTPGATVSWTGACPNNVAQGRGALQWFMNGVLGTYCEIELIDGKENGYGQCTYPPPGPDAGHYVGWFRNGERHGRGVYTWPNGGRYEGDLRDGRPDGQGTFREGGTGRAYSGKWVKGCFNEGGLKRAIGVLPKDCGF